MSATTPFLALYKPGGGSTGLILPDEVVDVDRINANSDLIDTFASSTNDKFVQKKQTGLVPGVSGAAARDAMYPLPTQGDRVYRLDFMYEEAYFEVYNSVSNKGGALAAGWYPVGGNVPRCLLSKTTAQNTANGTVVVNWGTALHDRFGMYGGAGNPTRITIATAGVYRIHSRLNSGTPMSITVLVNGAATTQVIGGGFTPAVGTNIGEAMSLMLPCAAGDYLEIRAAATSVTPLTTGGICTFAVEWVEPRIA